METPSKQGQGKQPEEIALEELLEILARAEPEKLYCYRETRKLEVERDWKEEYPSYLTETDFLRFGTLDQLDQYLKDLWKDCPLVQIRSTETYPNIRFSDREENQVELIFLSDQFKTYLEKYSWILDK